MKNFFCKQQSSQTAPTSCLLDKNHESCDVVAQLRKLQYSRNELNKDILFLSENSLARPHVAAFLQHLRDFNVLGTKDYLWGSSSNSQIEMSKAIDCIRRIEDMDSLIAELQSIQEDEKLLSQKRQELAKIDSQITELKDYLVIV